MNRRPTHDTWMQHRQNVLSRRDKKSAESAQVAERARIDAENQARWDRQAVERAGRTERLDQRGAQMDMEMQQERELLGGLLSAFGLMTPGNNVQSWAEGKPNSASSSSVDSTKIAEALTGLATKAVEGGADEATMNDLMSSAFERLESFGLIGDSTSKELSIQDRAKAAMDVFNLMSESGMFQYGPGRGVDVLSTRVELAKMAGIDEKLLDHRGKVRGSEAEAKRSQSEHKDLFSVSQGDDGSWSITQKAQAPGGAPDSSPAKPTKTPPVGDFPREDRAPVSFDRQPSAFSGFGATSSQVPPAQAGGGMGPNPQGAEWAKSVWGKFKDVTSGRNDQGFLGNWMDQKLQQR